MYDDINGRCQHETETGCLCMEPWPCPQHTPPERLLNPYGFVRIRVAPDSVPDRQNKGNLEK
jgi:hypothetical protein